jgi:hypothetical protein
MAAPKTPRAGPMRHRVPAAPQGILSPDNRKLLLVVVAVVAAGDIVEISG